MASTAHHDEQVPERTTPQGTQEEGVEHGHEEKDLDLAQVGGWFLGLAVTCIIAQILLWATFKWWSANAAYNDRLPSQVFRQRLYPPPPRILPNPIDYPETAMTNPRADAPDYPETLPGEREREDKALQQLGLQDPDGHPVIPDNIAARVITSSQQGGKASGAASASGLEERRPSVASGGTVLENALR